MASNSNTVNVRITGDATSLKTATDTATNELDKLGNSAQRAGGNGTDPLEPIGKKIDMNNLMEAGETVGQVGEKIMDVGLKSVRSAAQQQAMNAAFKQTMGDALPYANEQVNKLSKAYDILPNRIKPSYQQFTAMFKGLGIETNKAVDMASQAMRISANAAAYYDKSLEESNAALSSFVKGNYEGGEAVGIFANDTQMAAYAAKNNLIPATEGAKQASEELLIASEKAGKKQQEAIQKYGEGSLEAREASLKLKDVQDKINEELGSQTQKWADLDEATKQAVRLDYAENSMVLAGAIDKTGEMAGQASREADGYENQMGNLDSQMETFYATLGKDVLPLFLEGVKLAIDLFKQLGEIVGAIPEPIKQIIFVFGGIAGAIGMLAPTIAAFATIFTAGMAPVIGIVAGIALGISALIIVIQNWGAIWDWIVEKTKAIFEFLGLDFDAFKAKVEEVWNAIKETFTIVTTAISDFVMEMWSKLTTWWIDNQGLIERTAKIVWEGIKFVIEAVMNTIVPFLQIAWDTIKGIVTVAWDIIKNTVGTALDVILGIIKAIMRAINGDWDGAWQIVKDTAQRLWEGIKYNIKTILESLFQAIKDIVRNIGESISNKWNEIKENASRTWNAIKEAITAPFQQAWDTISGFIDRMKNAFDFQWKLPEIQLPQIPSIQLETSSIEILGKTITYPSGFNIQWHAKGGIFSQPTLLGGGHGVGEAGAEAVIPLNAKTLGGIGAGIARQMVKAANPEYKEVTPQGGNRSVVVNWTGDVDSPERIHELAVAINEEFMIMNNNGYN